MQYARFVEITREYAKLYDNREEAMNAAIDYCIGHGILEDVLRKHRSQVLGSLLEDFDEKKYERTIREEARGQEKYRLLVKLVKDGKLSVQDAADEADISVPDFKEKFLT